jgi:cardiolipin synthase
MIEIQGPAVRDAQGLFRERWVEEGGDAFDLGPRALGVGTDPRHPYFPRLEAHLGGAPVSILSTTPGARFQIYDDILGRFARAERRILVEVAYFTSREAWKHLQRAAERGVKVVCIFADDHNDSLEFLYAARLRYRELLQSGVEVFEYQRHMTHAKVVIVDDVSIIGSANLNNAGFFNHYEVSAVIPDAELTAGLAMDLFARDLSHSRRIEAEDVDALTAISAVARAYLKGVVDVWF